MQQYQHSMRKARMEIYASDFTQKRVIRDLFLWTLGQNSQVTIKNLYRQCQDEDKHSKQKENNKKNNFYNVTH